MKIGNPMIFSDLTFNTSNFRKVDLTPHPGKIEICWFFLDKFISESDFPTEI